MVIDVKPLSMLSSEDADKEIIYAKRMINLATYENTLISNEDANDDLVLMEFDSKDDEECENTFRLSLRWV